MKNALKNACSNVQELENQSAHKLTKTSFSSRELIGQPTKHTNLVLYRVPPMCREQENKVAAHTMKCGIRLQHTCQPYRDFNHFGIVSCKLTVMYIFKRTVNPCTF